MLYAVKIAININFVKIEEIDQSTQPAMFNVFIFNILATTYWFGIVVNLY